MSAMKSKQMETAGQSENQDQPMDINTDENISGTNHLN